ncbi:hypothetical protein AADA10_05280 [Kingella kingae]
MRDYIELFDNVVERMEKLSKWRFVAILATFVFCILAWKLPEILTVVLK